MTKNTNASELESLKREVRGALTATPNLEDYQAGTHGRVAHAIISDTIDYLSQRNLINTDSGQGGDDVEALKEKAHEATGGVYAEVADTIDYLSEQGYLKARSSKKIKCRCDECSRHSEGISVWCDRNIKTAPDAGHEALEWLDGRMKAIDAERNVNGWTLEQAERRFKIYSSIRTALTEREKLMECVRALYPHANPFNDPLDVAGLEKHADIIRKARGEG